jgi:hypothetical protein
MTAAAVSENAAALVRSAQRLFLSFKKEVLF